MNEDISKSTQAESTRADQDNMGPLFLANFVHQIVNPISGVIGTLDNVFDGTYDSVKSKQVINASRAQLEQCVSLIRNLAHLSDFFFATARNESGTARGAVTSTLPQVIIESIQFFQSTGEKKGIRLELLNPSDQYIITARPELLKQVFINLFDNWLKYGKQSQTVAIASKVNNNKELIIELRGKSIGFSHNDSQRIFEMGFRSQEAHNKVAQGSGIGLFICRKITEEVLHGNISATHSPKTEITTFRIRIPRHLWQI